MKKTILFFLCIFLFSPLIYAEDAGYYLENSAPVQISFWPPVAFPSGLNTVRGARANLIYGDMLNMYGIDAGLVQRARNEMIGIELGGVNITGNTFGIQGALLANIADSMRGFQFGIVNVAEDLKGVQIGIINKSGTRIMPIFNWSD